MLADMLWSVWQTSWYIWVAIGVIVVGKALWRVYENHKLSKSGLADIDKMDGKTFEKYLAVVFRRMGYQVTRTKYVGDYGADLVANKDGISYVIQAKRYKSKVGVKAVQEAVASKGYYKCDKTMVVTNSTYTKQAEELARANNVILWDRNKFVNEILKAKKEPEVEIQAPIPEQPIEQELAAIVDQETVCVVCGKQVSEKVKQYCADNSERFGGKVYCYEHQRKGVKV